MAEPSATPGEAVWYVVGIVRPAPSLAGVPTLLPDRPLETVEGDGLWAVACTVPADLLNDRAAEDIGRVSRLAGAHDRVLRALLERTVVVPARLGSLYPSRQAVAAMLHNRHRSLTAVLDQLAGRSEWGVKVYSGLEPDQAPASLDSGARAGTAYLQRKRAERQRSAADQQAAAALAAELHRTVAAHADAAVTRPPQHPKLSGVRAPMLLNAAYLVDGARQEAFTAVVRDLAARHRQGGLRVQLTGPWPPYSFAGPDGDRP